MRSAADSTFQVQLDRSTADHCGRQPRVPWTCRRLGVDHGRSRVSRPAKNYRDGGALGKKTIASRSSGALIKVSVSPT